MKSFWNSLSKTAETKVVPGGAERERPRASGSCRCPSRDAGFRRHRVLGRALCCSTCLLGVPQWYKYHKYSGSKLYKFTVLQFWGPEV